MPRPAREFSSNEKSVVFRWFAVFLVDIREEDSESVNYAKFGPNSLRFSKVMVKTSFQMFSFLILFSLLFNFKSSISTFLVDFRPKCSRTGALRSF